MALVALFCHAARQIVEALEALQPFLLEKHPSLAEGESEIQLRADWIRNELSPEQVAIALDVLPGNSEDFSNLTNRRQPRSRTDMQAQMDSMRCVVQEIHSMRDALATSMRQTTLELADRNAGISGGQSLVAHVKDRVDSLLSGMEQWVAGGYLPVPAHSADQRNEKYIYGCWNLWSSAVLSTWCRAMITDDVGPYPREIRMEIRGMNAMYHLNRVCASKQVELSIFRQGMLHCLVTLHTNLGRDGSGGGAHFGPICKRLYSLAVIIGGCSECADKVPDVCLLLLQTNPDTAVILLDEATDLCNEVQSDNMSYKSQSSIAIAVTWLLDELSMALYPDQNPELGYIRMPSFRPLSNEERERHYSCVQKCDAQQNLSDKICSHTSNPKPNWVNWDEIPSLQRRRGIENKTCHRGPGTQFLLAAAEVICHICVGSVFFDACLTILLQGNCGILRVLLDRGVPPSTCTSFGESGLMLAASRDNNLAVELLITAQASLDAVTREGVTALHMAAAFGR